MNIALRHLVYSELLWMLPTASIEQTDRFCANLALYRRDRKYSDNFNIRKTARRLQAKFIQGRVSPDVRQTPTGAATVREIETYLNRKFSGALDGIPGFFKIDDRWLVNLPQNCFLCGYREKNGLYAGILCQPLNRIDYFFMFSSIQKPNGAGAARMSDKDAEFFNQFQIAL